MATAVVAMCLAAMLVSVCIAKGFRNEIEDKLMGFSGHIQITRTTNPDIENVEGVAYDDKILDFIRKDPTVKSLQPFIFSPGIIKAGDLIEGIRFKGIDSSFDTGFISNHILEGRFINTKSKEGNEAVISTTTAQRLGLKVGNDLRVYFVGSELKGRKFNIVGIYETGLEDFDKSFAWCGIWVLQKLNGRDSNNADGMEVMLKDIKLISSKTDAIHHALPPDMDAASIRETFPELMDWLDLVGQNVYIVLALMLAVAVISMITAILVLMIERTAMIGTFKSFGSSNFILTQVFMMLAGKLALWGIFWGNLVAFGFIMAQQKFHLITLPQESYYMKYVPVEIDWALVLPINIGTLVVCIVFMLLPSLIINRISPLAALRFK
ncbi:MAG: ABC transporter permease [Bacteroidota bacterium]|nr:ABC transporter permease [Bacteroidota bacterium]